MKELALLYDYFKQLIVLSTGSILLIIAFLEKLFPNPEWKLLVGVSLVAFVSAIISNLAAMLFIIIHETQEVKVIGSKESVDGLTISITSVLSSFLIGILSIVIFALKNLF